MVHFGIDPKNAYGISIPVLRKVAKEIGKDHSLALQLWDSEIHEARILAGMIDDPELVTEKQMDDWAKDFNSWDICDGTCLNLFRNTPFAYKKAIEWSNAKQEYIKRAGFSMMACLAVGDKEADDGKFRKFFSYIKKEALDERNFVRKAVNWALRQIGKRNMNLNRLAAKVASEIQKMDSKSARWIAQDALRELKNPKTINRIRKKI